MNASPSSARSGVKRDLTTTRGIIDALGGTAGLRALVAPTALSNWRKNGIPRLRWGDVIEFAAQRRIRGITVAVLRAASEQHAKPAE